MLWQVTAILYCCVDLVPGNGMHFDVEEEVNPEDKEEK